MDSSVAQHAPPDQQVAPVQGVSNGGAGVSKRAYTRTQRRFLCAWPGCGKAFNRQANVRRHARAEHERTFAFTCDICEKPCREHHQLEQHRLTHPPALHALAALRPGLHRMHARLCAAEAELCRLRIESARAASPRCSASVCAVATAQRSNDAISFSCIACNKRTHWGCAGLQPDSAGADFGDLCDHAICQPCLAKEARQPHACVEAATNAMQLQHHIKHDLRKTLIQVAGDGLCMVRSVAAVLERSIEPGLSHLDVLRAALHVVPSLVEDSTVALGENKVAVLAECAKLLAAKDACLTRKMARAWDSLLLDVLPPALARSMDRPLHILQVVRGELIVHVVERQLPGAPIVMAKSWSEIGRDHYQAVV